MNTKKRHFSIPILLSLLAIVLTIFSSCVSEISGDEWIERQHYFFDELEAFGKEMDTIYTLYFTGKISDDDFKTEVDTLNTLYSYLELKREKEKEEYPVAPEGHTFISKECTKSLDNILNTYNKILNSTFNEDGSPVDVKNLSYTYMKYRRDIIDNVAGYEASILVHKEEKAEKKKSQSQTQPSTSS